MTGEEGDEPGLGLVRPLSVAVRGGEILVCDAGLNAVIRIDLASGAIRPLVRRDAPQPLKPVAVVVDSAGDAFVADAGGGDLWRVDSEGSVRMRYRPLAPTPRFEPIGVAASADRIFAVNRVSRTVEVFERESGRHLGRLDNPPSTNKEDAAMFPAALSVDAAGRVYVVDVIGCVVRIYAPDGRSIGQIGGPGDRPGQFARPRSVVVGPEGTLYVSDTATQVVQAISAAGEPLMSFGGSGSDAGAMTLPAGLCIDSSLIDRFRSKMPDGFEPRYLILVANQLGPGRIGVYAFGQFATGGADQGAPQPAGVGR